MTLVEQIIIDCWVIFGVVWTIGAVTAKRAQRRQTVGKRLWYAVFLMISFVLLFKGFPTATPGTGLKEPIYPLYIPVLPYSATFAAVAAALTILGLLLALWARWILGRNWSGTVDIKKDHELVTNGPYAVIRHPIYTAFLLMFLGTAIAVGNLGGFLGFVTLFISHWIKLKQEEQLMTQQFPTAYLAYMKRTKALIPFVL